MPRPTSTDRARKWAEENAKLRARIMELEEENERLKEIEAKYEGLCK